MDLVEKMKTNVKRMQKTIKVLSKEAATLEVEKLKQKDPQPSFAIVKRSSEECDSAEFQNTLIRELKAALPDLRLIVVFMEDKPTSQLLACSSDEELLKKVALALCETLDIKLGAAGPVCKNGRFQAKFTGNAKSLKLCDQLLEDLLASPQ